MSEFLKKCETNPDYCGKLDAKTRKCSEDGGYCPVRIIKIDGKYVCNTLKPNDEKLLSLLCTVIPNNTTFGLKNVYKDGDSLVYEFGSVYSDKPVKIIVG